METKNDIFQSKDYITSRRGYVSRCAFDYFMTILVSDAYLAKLLTSIGVSDAIAGIIASFISLAFVFQLLSIFLVEHIKSVKKTTIFFEMVGHLSFMMIYIIPFLPIGISAKTILVMVCMLVAYFAKYLISGTLFAWGNSFVSPDNRGKFSASKEIISLVSGLVFTLVISRFVDKFESLGNLNGAFLFIAITMLVLNILNFFSIMQIKDTKNEKVQKHDLKLVLKKTFGNKNFRGITILHILWNIARYTTMGFMGTYKTKELLMTVGMVQIINIIGLAVRAVISRPFGKYSDKTSYAKGFSLALLIAAAGFGINAFSSPDRIWCVVLFVIMDQVSMAGTSENSFNMTYSYVESDYIVQAMAIKNSIGGLVGFGATLIGSRILFAVQQNGNSLYGMTVYGQQVLSAISCVVVIITFLFNYFVVEKQKVMKQ